MTAQPDRVHTDQKRAVANAPAEAITLASTMEDLRRRGFDDQFTVANDRLRSVKSGAEFAADEVTVAGSYRFEGVSAPDDMAVLYALETRTGARGTLTDAFGVYADPKVGEFMKAVQGVDPP